MRLVFIDNRPSIVQKVRDAGYPTILGDYFEESHRIGGVITSASNPMFTFGGGLDRQLYDLYPEVCADKRRRGGGNERVGNIIFLISVGRNYEANDDLVRDALVFARDNTKNDETLCICAIGTSIGHLPEDTFIEIFKEVFAPPSY